MPTQIWSIDVQERGQGERIVFLRKGAGAFRYLSRKKETSVLPSYHIQKLT